MKPIMITNNTWNTKRLRKQIYQSALEYMVSWYNNGTYDLGLCAAIDESIDRSKVDLEIFNPYSPYNVYVEITRFKPEGCSPSGAYWFPLDNEGTEKRILILRNAIDSL